MLKKKTQSKSSNSQCVVLANNAYPSCEAISTLFLLIGMQPRWKIWGTLSSKSPKFLSLRESEPRTHWEITKYKFSTNPIRGIKTPHNLSPIVNELGHAPLMQTSILVGEEGRHRVEEEEEKGREERKRAIEKSSKNIFCSFFTVNLRKISYKTSKLHIYSLYFQLRHKIQNSHNILNSNYICSFNRSLLVNNNPTSSLSLSLGQIVVARSPMFIH